VISQQFQCSVLSGYCAPTIRDYVLVVGPPPDLEMRIALDLGGQYSIGAGTTNLEPLHDFGGANTLVAQDFDFGCFGTRGRGRPLYLPSARTLAMPSRLSLEHDLVLERRTASDLPNRIRPIGVLVSIAGSRITRLPPLAAILRSRAIA
jgi:hypothetical protein